MRYGTTRSATLPDSRVPYRASIPMARAPFSVAAVMASSGERTAASTRYSISVNSVGSGSPSAMT
jgi:hypothetical protein